MKEVPKIAVDVLEYCYRSIGLFLWPANESDAFIPIASVIALKVVSAAELATNKYAPALWNLVSESNSVPIKDFNYGAPIQGMHPAIKGAPPDPLEPGVKYRLFVETHSLKAEHEFMPEPRAK